MKRRTLPKMSGIALAVAAAGFAAGCTTTQSSSSGASASANSTDLVHCYGVNQCGGHNDCKTAENACAGQAACKGHGFVAMPSKACGDVGGETKDSWVGEIAKADLIHCYGVNKCGGHNDCKTAENACAGQASCKGHGFVAAPAKACGDIGGESGA